MSFFTLKRKWLIAGYAVLLCALCAMPATAAPVKVLKQANSAPDNAPIPIALEKMGLLLEQKSGGTMKMENFSNSQLGTARECLESVQAGVIDITSQTLAAMGASPTRG